MVASVLTTLGSSARRHERSTGEPATLPVPAHLRLTVHCDYSVLAAPMDVLLIEDDAVVRALLAELLDEAGLHVVERSDGENLFAPDPGFAAPPRVVVTDMDLGAGCHGGLEVAEQARRRWPEVGVVFITGRPSNLNGHALGRRDRFLPKPFPAASLILAVAGLLHI
jgi:CheY-like chemotaxis protein